VKAQTKPGAKLVNNKDKKAEVVGYCPCGCQGELAKGIQFKPGHDRRMHGLFKKVHKAKMKEGDLTHMQQAIYALWCASSTLKGIAVAIKTEWACFR